MFYSSRLPFNLARNLYYVNSYSFAANHMLNGFLPPGYNALRTTLLQQEKAHVERLLKPIKSTWNAKGVSIVSDGWTDVQRRPLINFMATSIDDVGKAQAAKEFILNDVWWDKITYILNFTEPIYSMLRACDTDSLTLHLVYEITTRKMINETVVALILRPFIRRFFKTVAKLFNIATVYRKPSQNLISPHEDEEISMERNKCLKKLFTTAEERRKVSLEYADFSSKAHNFASFDSIEDRWTLDAKSWWVMHGSSAPLLQKLSLKLLVQPSSSSCCERNWSTYSFIHSLKRNKLNPKRAEDLVYVHTNLRLLSRKSEEYMQGSTRMWDIGGDAWGSFDGVENLEVASLSLDEPEMEAVLFTDDGQGGDEIDTIPISRQ
uniref:HAT C-terminal dimerisation domain-containing protein n=1 Tax=Cajanus cajan TaxID=3821 RepID=A0A151R8I7_CAJCA|nr:hypothetical protein KK1_039915 [Cajanus cajan]